MNPKHHITSLIAFLFLCPTAFGQGIDAKEVLRQALKRANSANSLGISLSMEPDKTVVEDPASYKMLIQIIVEGAKNARVEMKMPGQEVLMLENGEKRSTYHVQKGFLKSAASAPRETLIAKMISGPLGELSAWLAGYIHNNPKILGDIVSAEGVGEETVNGIETGHFFYEYPNFNVDLYLMKANVDPLKIVFTLKKYSMADAESLGKRKGGKVVCTIDTWAHDVKTAPDFFAHTKPAAPAMTENTAEKNETGEEKEPSNSTVEFQNLGPAPDIDLQLMDGGTFRLSDYTGRKAVILDFWASWCGPCKKSLPILQKVHGEIRPRNVEIITINLDQDRSAAERFARNSGLTLPVAYDEFGEAASSYRAASIPTTAIVSEKGELIFYESGVAPDYESKLKAIINALEQGSH